MRRNLYISGYKKPSLPSFHGYYEGKMFFMRGHHEWSGFRVLVKGEDDWWLKHHSSEYGMRVGHLDEAKFNLSWEANE